MIWSKKVKIGIIGCGTIGAQLAEAIVNNKLSNRARLVALCDLDETKTHNLKAKLAAKVKVVNLDQLIRYSHLVVEAAQTAIADQVARKTLKRGKDVLIMSVGGILNQAPELFALAQAKNCRIYLPSGALAGLDAVKSAAMAGISKATLVTRKPPKGLIGAPYLLEKNIDLSRIKQETVLFEGTAKEAISGFPRNVNVCAALSLAAIGADRTRVKIITSPEYTANIHQVELEGDFGKLVTRTENFPSPMNPKTSYLAVLSAMATLKNALDVIKIGT